MNAEICVLSGTLAGSVVRLNRTIMSVGRNRDVDLRFDPRIDLDVSGRHAVFTPTPGGTWIVRDLGSTNGTYVNGIRLLNERPLRTGDRVRFGPSGPEVEFRALHTSASSSSAAALTAAKWRVFRAPELRDPEDTPGGCDAQPASEPRAPEVQTREGQTPLFRETMPTAESEAPWIAPPDRSPAMDPRFAPWMTESAPPSPRRGGAGGSRRLWIVGITVALLAGAAGAAFEAARRDAFLAGERMALQQRIEDLSVIREDSILALENELRQLSAALRTSRGESQGVSPASPRSAGEATGTISGAGTSGTPAAPARVPDNSSGRISADAPAAVPAPPAPSAPVARLDLLEVLRLNRHAVALVWVENEFGEVSTGTAFAVRPDATLVTSRHVVAGEDGSLHPRRLAIQFSDSDQVWPARILTISTDEDLAIVKVDNILGDVPVARTFNTRPDTLEEGSIIASIGFPVGRNPSPRAAGVGDTFASPLLSAGVLLSTTSGRIEFQGYGAAGASGSPVFDANGSVIAVLSGGFSNEDPPRVVGVPFSAVAELLAELP